jgi:uncharacterized protein YoxC
MSPEISRTIITLAVLVLTAVTVPAILQIWKAAKGLSQTIETLNKNLPNILKSLTDITDNINRTTNTINNQVDKLALLTGRIQGIMSFVLDIEQLLLGRIKNPAFRAFSTITAVGKGVKSFLRVYRSGH